MPTVITYNHAASGTQGRLDIYLKPNAPVIVLIQHGGWLQVDKRDSWMLPWIEAFHDDNDFTVVGLNWRFAPTALYPVYMEDLDRAIRTAERRIARAYHRARVPINVLGLSSGGHIAALWALNRAAYAKDYYDSALQVPKVCCIAGVYDLEDATLGAVAEGLIDGMVDHAGWKRPASPITYAALAGAQSTQYYLAHGEDDDLIPFATQFTAMKEALEDAGADVTAKNYVGVDHSIGQNTNVQGTGWAARFAEIISFLET